MLTQLRGCTVPCAVFHGADEAVVGESLAMGLGGGLVKQGDCDFRAWREEEERLGPMVGMLDGKADVT